MARSLVYVSIFEHAAGEAVLSSSPWTVYNLPHKVVSFSIAQRYNYV